MIYMYGIAETLFLEFSPGHQKIMNRRVSYTYVIVFAMNKGSLLLSQQHPSNSKSAELQERSEFVLVQVRMLGCGGEGREKIRN